MNDTAARLLDWYDRQGRSLPWRMPGPDPYHVWLSEVMLQQTGVRTVIPYFHDFLGRWPDVHALAAADRDAVMHAWQGLGYYARARNLHACAGVVSREHGGAFPDTEDGLRALPGIGAYTAAAVAAIAFGRPTVPVDGNVERVMARLHAEDGLLPEIKQTLADRARALVPPERPGDFAQALMDLGATLCTPRRPACALCPWRDGCLGRLNGIAEALPNKPKRRARPTRHGVAFWLVSRDGNVLLRRRPSSGLLGGMMEIPSTDWTEEAWDVDAALGESPAPVKGWRVLPGVVRHTFTHFHLELTVAFGRISVAESRVAGRWVAVEHLGDHALPSVMKKVVRHAIRHGYAKP